MPRMIGCRVEDPNPAFNSLLDSENGITVRTFTSLNPRSEVRSLGELVMFFSHDSVERAEEMHRLLAAIVHNETEENYPLANELLADTPSAYYN